MTYSVGDFVQDGERWVIPYEKGSRLGSRTPIIGQRYKAIVNDDKTVSEPRWGIYLYGLPRGAALTASGAKIRAVELLNAPEIFCHTPDICTAAGRCLLDPVCND